MPFRNVSPSAIFPPFRFFSFVVRRRARHVVVQSVPIKEPSCRFRVFDRPSVERQTLQLSRDRQRQAEREREREREKERERERERERRTHAQDFVVTTSLFPHPPSLSSWRVASAAARTAFASFRFAFPSLFSTSLKSFVGNEGKKSVATFFVVVGYKYVSLLFLSFRFCSYCFMWSFVMFCCLSWFCYPSWMIAGLDGQEIW